MTQRTEARPVTVRQLLATDSLLHEGELVAGSGGLDRIVTDVLTGTIQGTTAALPSLPNALHILDGGHLRGDNYQVDMAILHAADTGAAGIVVCTTRATIALAAIRLADKLKLPIIVASRAAPVILADALRQIVRAPLLVRSTALMEAVESLRKASQSTGMDAVLADLGTILNGRVALLGSDGTLVAGDAAGRALDPRHLIEVPTTTRVAPHVYIAQPLSLARREPPGFWLVIELSDPTDFWCSVAADALGISAWFATSRLVADRLERERDARFRVGVLNAIVAGSERPEPILLEHLAILGWQVDGWCTGIHVQATGDADALRILTLTDEFTRALSAAGLSGPVIERPDGWTMWTVQRREPEASTYRSMSQRLAKALESFVARAPRMNLHGGIGRPYAGLAGLRTSLAEAKESATIAQAAGGTTGVQHVDEMGVRRILLGWYASESFAEFAHTLLDPLLAADTDGSLLQTLECYLDSESSATLAAAALDVHRNTILNRVERLRSLLTVDLDDPEERLAVQLACRVIRLKERE